MHKGWRRVMAYTLEKGMTSFDPHTNRVVVGKSAAADCFDIALGRSASRFSSILLRAGCLVSACGHGVRIRGKALAALHAPFNVVSLAQGEASMATQSASSQQASVCIKTQRPGTMVRVSVKKGAWVVREDALVAMTPDVTVRSWSQQQQNRARDNSGDEDDVRSRDEDIVRLVLVQGTTDDSEVYLQAFGNARTLSGGGGDARRKLLVNPALLLAVPAKHARFDTIRAGDLFTCIASSTCSLDWALFEFHGSATVIAQTQAVESLAVDLRQITDVEDADVESTASGDDEDSSYLESEFESGSGGSGGSGDSGAGSPRTSPSQ